MTRRDIRILSWTCLMFGWTFVVAGDPDLGAFFMLFPLVGFAYLIITAPRKGGGGPLKPA